MVRVGILVVEALALIEETSGAALLSDFSIKSTCKTAVLLLGFPFRLACADSYLIYGYVVIEVLECSKRESVI